MTVTRHLSRALAALWFVAASCTARASACPVCDSETGQSVRAGILNDDLSANAWATALPFLVLGIVISAVHFAGLSRRSDAERRVARELPCHG